MLAVRGLLLGMLLASLSALAGALECMGYSSPVITYPAGNIALQYGNPLKIYCVVEPPYNSSQLFFQQRVGDDIVKYETQIVNQTTARLYVKRPERLTSIFECVLETGGTMFHSSRSCYNFVIVDTAPEKVTEFQCRSYNLERLECKWRVPTHYIKTNYSLTFKIYTLESNSCAIRHNGEIYSCVFGAMSTDAPYRIQEGVYNFTLTSANRFGTIKQLFYVDHYAVLFPRKPFNLLKLNMTSNSVLLQWQIPQDIADFTPGVDHKIMYQIKTVDNLTTWRPADMSTLLYFNKTTYRYLLRLPYAHWSYNVRIFIKSILAPDEDEFWSQYEGTTFTTSGKPPPRPPRTELGAFRSHIIGAEERYVYVYWQQIDEYEESGENFNYNVLIKHIGLIHFIRYETLGYIHFITSPHNAVNVSITSSNSYGPSVHNSYIYVPDQADILLPPTNFTKTVFGNRTYDLRWQPPKQTLVDSYTLFWCSNTESEACNGKLNFVKLNYTKTSYRITVSENDNPYTFAISANRGELSSGMVSVTCNMPGESFYDKVRYFKLGPNLGRWSVELQWDLGCTFSVGQVKGYNVTYCSERDANIFYCGGKERFLTIENPYQNNVNVTGLMPHSTYMFYIAVIYKHGTGYWSYGVQATTLEDKPSEPLNLNIL